MATMATPIFSVEVLQLFLKEPLKKILVAFPSVLGMLEAVIRLPNDDFDVRMTYIKECLWEYFSTEETEQIVSSLTSALAEKKCDGDCRCTQGH